LRLGRFDEIAHVIGDQRFDARAPFAVSLSPEGLVRPR
jgi:hypothetical protein